MNSRPSAYEDIGNIIKSLSEKHELQSHLANRALIAAPFGQSHFNDCINKWQASTAIAEMSKTGALYPLIITSADVDIRYAPDSFKIVQIDSIPDWRQSNRAFSRFVKWAAPMLFPNIGSSIYLDSELYITNKPDKLERLFNVIEKDQLVLTHHSLRTGWEDEYQAVLSRLDINNEPVKRQAEFFKEQQLPTDTPVYKATFIGFSHQAKFKPLLLAVLNQLATFSDRDQLALVYAVHQSGLTPRAYNQGVYLSYYGNDKSENSLCFMYPTAVKRRFGKLFRPRPERAFKLLEN